MHRRTLFALFFSVFSLSPVSAQKLPLWELGLATGYISIPYYRGSSANREIVLPMPLAIYRGKNKSQSKAKRRSWYVFSGSVKLAISFAASLPVPEGVSAVRRGMSTLNATIEIGPKLVIDLWKSRKHSLSLNLPLRGMSAIPLMNKRMQGWVFSPFVHYIQQNKWKNGWNLAASAGIQYGSQKYHAYFYSVESADVSTTRTLYAARSGYSGSRISVYMQKSFNRLWLSAFARVDYIVGASFDNSPLVERKKSMITGFIVGWVFNRSPH